MKEFKAENIISHICLTILTFISISPLVWIIISSLKGKEGLTGNPTAFWSKTWTFDYYAHAINNLESFVNTKNGVIIFLVITLIAITVATLAAYGIVRFFMRLGSATFKVLVTTCILPSIPLAIPHSVVMGKLEFVSTRINLIIMYLSFSVPCVVWLLTRFLRTVPLETEGTTRIDGVNKTQAFVRVMLPLVTPGVVATTIYTFIDVQNEFLYALTLMNNINKVTVAVALRPLDGAEILDWGDMIAASTLVVLPSVTFFCLIQNRIVGGISNGAVKS